MLTGDCGLHYLIALRLSEQLGVTQAELARLVGVPRRATTTKTASPYWRQRSVLTKVRPLVGSNTSPFLAGRARPLMTLCRMAGRAGVYA